MARPYAVTASANEIAAKFVVATPMMARRDRGDIGE